MVPHAGQGRLTDMSAPETVASTTPGPGDPAHGAAAGSPGGAGGSSPRRDGDQWMDEHAPDTRIQRLHIFTPLVEAPRRFVRFTSQTPGLLTVVSVVLTLALLAAGGAMVWSSSSRQGELNTLVSKTEPVSFASQELYNSLSVADTVASSGFLDDSSRTADTRPEYRQAMDTASRAVVRAAAGIDEPSSREMSLILDIQEKLPLYVSMITEAGANNRQGYPLGAAYITQASGMMQDEILPAAAELYDITSSAVTDRQSSLTRPSWFALSGLVAAVVLLVLSQFWLSAWTNRRINPGYLAATVLMIIALAWAGTSALTTWRAGAHGVTGNAQPLQTLTSLRINAQQARTTEILGLVQRDTTDDSQTGYSERVAAVDAGLEKLRGELDGADGNAAIDDAREQLRTWDSAHAQMATMLRRGDYSGAVAAALGDHGAANVSEAYDKLDSDLQDLIDDSRGDLREFLSGSRGTAQRTAALVLVLSLLSILLVIQGTRPRLQEYL
jgi:hypothetical protein